MAVIMLLLEVAKNDLKTKRIPNKLNDLIFLAGIVSLWIVCEITFVQRCLGCLAVSVPLLLIAVMVPGSFGGGDIKLMFTSGFLLGVCYIWKAFAVGIVSAGIYVIVALITKKADRKTEIALGPFLCIGIIYSMILI